MGIYNVIGAFQANPRPIVVTIPQQIYIIYNEVKSPHFRLPNNQAPPTPINANAITPPITDCIAPTWLTRADAFDTFEMFDMTGWTTLIDWAKEKDDEVARSVVIDTVDQWEKLGRKRGLYLPFLYMNDAAREQNPIARYGEENVNRLKEVSLKYDPSQLFQTLQNGGFQLSSASQLGT
ncbi:hypothetical protein F4805DRAFT_463934 [Annulohypoxylon moriforme]|nr:hypothetical protein F4805DRAFT_463934 [Annulohypoxylon moriforme]